jgi:hypothetical protein
MVLIGCTPGGTTSNLFTYFSRGDLPLSISMTIVSSDARRGGSRLRAALAASANSPPLPSRLVSTGEQRGRLLHDAPAPHALRARFHQRRH